MMMLTPRLGSIAWVLISTFCIQGCTVSPDHTAELRLIDSLAVEVDEQAKLFDALDQEKILALMDSIELQVQQVQVNYVGEMKLSTATLIAEFKKIRGNLPTTEEAFEKVRGEIQYTKTQLANLRSMLVEKATIDAKGTVIDKNYIATALETEKTAAEDLVAKLKRMLIRSNAVFSEFETKYPRVKALVDSIPPNPKPVPGLFSEKDKEEND